MQNSVLLMLFIIEQIGEKITNWVGRYSLLLNAFR